MKLVQEEEEKRNHAGVLRLHFRISLLVFDWIEYHMLSVQILVQFVAAGDISRKVIFCMTIRRSSLLQKNGSLHGHRYLFVLCCFLPAP